MLVDDLGSTLDKNISRVQNLMAINKEATNLKKGRKSTKSSDIMRATVVLLHSTLEDFLRTLLKLNLPNSGEDNLKSIPLGGATEFNRKTKFGLEELARHKGKTVEQVIELSVHQYLDRQSFNNSSDISSALQSIGIAITPKMQSFYPKLDEMIKRRHNIVHQADRQGATVDKFIIEIVKQI